MNNYFNTEWLPYWKPNGDSKKCDAKDCDKKFGYFSRRHHCRKCGLIFCNKCWGSLAYVKTYYKKVPVCHECYNQIDEKIENEKED